MRTLIIAALALGTAPTDWDAGVKAFREAEALTGAASRDAYVRSAAAFAAAAREAPDHVEAHINLATASYRAGMLPEAIAACRAGLAIHPFDPRLHAQLDAARRDVVLPEKSRLERPTSSWLRWGIVAHLEWLAAAGVLIAALFLPAGIRSGHRTWRVIGAAGIVVAVIGAGLVGLRHQAIADAADVVVLHDDTPLRTGNAEAFPATESLPRGYEVRRLGERGDWLHVQCPGGQIGWIPNVGRRSAS